MDSNKKSRHCRDYREIYLYITEVTALGSIAHCPYGFGAILTGKSSGT